MLIINKCFVKEVNSSPTKAKHATALLQNVNVAVKASFYND